mgnify:FL=1
MLKTSSLVAPMCDNPAAILLVDKVRPFIHGEAMGRREGLYFSKKRNE